MQIQVKLKKYIRKKNGQKEKRKLRNFASDQKAGVPDCVLCVYSGHLHVPFLDGLLELELLRLLLLVALLAAPLQLLRRELQVEQVLLHAGQRHF
jgi:hypothetical protein